MNFDPTRSASLARASSIQVLILALAVYLLTACSYASAADVMYVGKSPAQNPTRQQVEAVAEFYGLTLDVHVAISGKRDAALLQSLRSPRLLAVVVDADALPMVDEKAIAAFLRRGEKWIPLLIAGINENTNRDCLRQWSSGDITAAQKPTGANRSGSYAIASGNEVTRQLGGSRLPLVSNDVRYLTLTEGAKTEGLMRAELGAAELPVFARREAGGREVFFATEIRSVDTPPTPDPYRQQLVFVRLAPTMMFLHYAAGEHAWHTPGIYANFTIDDLWLREPYGHVNYEGLLEEAQRHNFHATVAFIPWNFDRSEPKVVALFQKFPNRLSVCVHGNDHVHQEFGPLESHPLQKQVEGMKQGLARMEKFSALTKIPFDAVMVFPHSIAPEATFAELRRNHYLATANSLNVPSDASAPPGADFALRTATMKFGEFPSLRRYSAETDIPPAQLAIDAFLGNAMLFYAHESYFAAGVGAFDQTADFVNRLQPDIQWKSLGTIARHLYLEKQRSDGNYDLRALSANIQILNTHGRDAEFFVQRDEDFSQPFVLLVDGEPYPYEKTGLQIRLKIPIHKGGVRELSIRYGNSSELANIDISKRSLRTNAIRRLSDFRDNTVSKTRLGRGFIRSYAENGRNWNLAIALGFLLVLLAVWLVRRHPKMPKGGRHIQPARQME
jgi:hypothetical protein